MKALSRRQFVRRAATAAVAIHGFGAHKAFANPLDMDVGLQLYSVKDDLEKDFDGTLKAVAAIGYRQVESSLSVGSKSAKEIRAAVEALGLGWKSAHSSVAEMHADADRLIGQAQDAGVQRIISSAPWIKDPSRIKKLDPSDPLVKTYGQYAQFVAALESMTMDDWKWNADVLNETGEKAKKAGIRVGYHNHTFEFKKHDGVLAYDELLRLTDPTLVDFQLDCGWMVYSGYDPVDYLANHPKRYCSLHIKDLAKDSGRLGQGLMIHTTEVGNGTIDWKKIFDAARQTAVGAYYVEQEPPYTRPPLESAKISYDYLRTLSV